MRFPQARLALTAVVISACAAGCQGATEPVFAGNLSLSLVGQTGEGRVAVGAPSPCEIDIDFGTVRLAQQASATIAITDKSNTAISLLAFTPTLDPEFSLAFAVPLPQVVPAGGAAQLSVSFQAVAVGPVTSIISVPTDAPPLACNSASSSSLTIKVTANAVDLKLAVSPQFLDFGTTLIAQSVTKTITLTNTSTAPIGGISGLMGGANPSEFNVAGGPSWLDAGASAPVQVTFTPLVSRAKSAASATFTGADGESAVATLVGEPVSSGLVLSPASLSFGYVVPPATLVECTTATNQIGVPIIVSAIADFANVGGAFSLSSTDDSVPPGPALLPVTVAPGASAKVCFSFAPPAPASDTQFLGQATLVSNDPSGSNPIVALSGWGGGPVLSCTPGQIDFGEVLENSAITVPVTCTNVGTAIPETNLRIGVPETTGKMFTASFDQGTEVYPDAGLSPGQSVRIDVQYAPTLTAHDQGVLVLTSNGGQGKGLQIPLTGQGLDLAPCQFTLVPDVLNFGNLAPGQSSVLSFGIQNVGSSDCLVKSLQVSDQTTSVFQLVSTSIAPDPESGDITLPSPLDGEPSTLVAQVSFSPAIGGAYAAQALFWISEPGDLNQSVPLTGTSEPACLLVEPSKLDFGTVGTSQQGPFCSSANLLFTIYNVCTTEAAVQSFGLQSGAGDSIAQFSAPSGAAVPLALSAGSSSLFELSFDPTTLGTHTAELLVSDGNDIDSRLSLTGTAVAAPTQTDDFVVAPASVDVLLLVEVGDSPDLQAEIVSAIPGFLAAAKGIDYRIAVTTDDDDSKIATAELGRLLPCPTCSLSGASPTIVSPTSVPPGGTSADPATVLSGLYGSVPNHAYPAFSLHFFLALYNALLSEPATGVDFFRPGAAFVVIADNERTSDDASVQGAGAHGEQWYANFLNQYFPEPYLLTWDQIGPTSTITGTGLSVPSELPINLGLMVSATNGLGINSRDSNWTSALAGVWTAAESAAAQYPLSTFPPSGSDSIAVVVNGVPVSQAAGDGGFNWTYQGVSNSIAFTANHPVASGDQIAVSYPIGCQ